MSKSNLITRKIEELIDLAEIENEPNVKSILFALSGARVVNMDDNLAAHVRKYVSEVLLPKARADKENHQARQN